MENGSHPTWNPTGNISLPQTTTSGQPANVFVSLNIQLRVSFSFVGKQLVSYIGFGFSRAISAGGKIVIIAPLRLKFRRGFVFLTNPQNAVKLMLLHIFQVI